MHINSEAEPCQKCKPVTLYKCEKKISTWAKGKTHLWCQPFCELLYDDCSFVCWVVFSCFCFLQRCDGQRESTPGVNGAPVCSFRLKPFQVQSCSLCVIPDIQGPLKSFQKGKFCRGSLFWLSIILTKCLRKKKNLSNSLFLLQAY